MRIAGPEHGVQVDLGTVNLHDEALYTEGNAHAVFHALRVQAPVFWNALPGPGFWAVTRHADVRRVLRDHATFSSERGTVLSMLGAPVDPAAGKMMAVTDPPCHHEIREPIGRPLAPHHLAPHGDWLRDLVREVTAPAWEGDVWDAAAAFARLPVLSVSTLMGFPREDVESLLRWSYACGAPQDPHYRTGSERATLFRAHHEIMDYFRHRVRERRARPGDDLLSNLLALEVAGRPITDEEVIVNCYSLLLGGVVTTSQAIIAALVALVETGHGEGRWPLSAPAQAAAEEMVRWASPTTHFMRYARRDVVLADKLVKEGDAVTAWIASANRDDEVFDDPYVFDPRRWPNQHLGYGGGAHYCVGHGLARLTLHTVVEEFLTRVDCFELAEPPVHLLSNSVGGIVSAPLRIKMRNTGGPPPLALRTHALPAFR